MASLLLSTLLKIALPAATAGLVLFAARKRGLSWRNDLGFKAPKPAAWLFWLALWVGWVVLGEFLGSHFGLEQAKAWPQYPLPIVLLRIVAIGMVGPLAEETLMRGLLLHLLRRTFLGVWGAVAVAATAWAAMHYAYGMGTVMLIVADGLILGIARYRSGSLWVPISMHMLGNLFSISQSLAG
ncbi:MAG: CPBP family glutamic-type intramembrane protease [Pseudoxanthomonas sp.]